MGWVAVMVAVVVVEEEGRSESEAQHDLMLQQQHTCEYDSRWI
jgi:hypothetical protein